MSPAAPAAAVVLLEGTRRFALHVPLLAVADAAQHDAVLSHRFAALGPGRLVVGLHLFDPVVLATAWADAFLLTLEALLRAMDRRDEVFRVVDDSETVDEAIRRVGQLLGLGAVSSRAVIDLQVRGFTGGQRRAMASRAGELRSMLLDGR